MASVSEGQRAGDRRFKLDLEPVGETGRLGFSGATPPLEGQPAYLGPATQLQPRYQAYGRDVRQARNN